MKIAILLLSIFWSVSFEVFGECSQSNIELQGFKLTKPNGEAFSVTDEYTLGQNVNGELWVFFGGSSSNGYSMSFKFDILKDGVLVQDNQLECLFPGSAILKNQWVKIKSIDWNWGEIITISDISASWETNDKETSCNSDLSRAAQCYTTTNSFTAAIPLFPKFDFQSNGICNTTIQFTSQTIGGTPPFNYTFTWDFGGLGQATGENPTFPFPSTGVYTIGLTANDGVSTTTIYKNIFIDPNFGIQVDIFPTKLDDKSGIIYVKNITGGTEPYSYQWTGPDGFTSNSKDIFGLTDGLYTLVVTDSNGCQQTEYYVLDIASVLRFDWKSFDIVNQNDKIIIEWEVLSELEGSKYLIERSLGNTDDFVKIGEIDNVKTSESAVTYQFKDSSFPIFEEMIYYRITKIIGTFKFYSPIKLVHRENPTLKNKWVVYPNPSLNSDVQLISLNNSNQKNDIILELINSGNYYKTIQLKSYNNQILNLKELFGELPKGVLYLKVIDYEKVETLKIINYYN